MFINDFNQHLFIFISMSYFITFLLSVLYTHLLLPKLLKCFLAFIAFKNYVFYNIFSQLKLMLGKLVMPIFKKSFNAFMNGCFLRQLWRKIALCSFTSQICLIYLIYYLANIAQFKSKIYMCYFKHFKP